MESVNFNVDFTLQEFAMMHELLGRLPNNANAYMLFKKFDDIAREYTKNQEQNGVQDSADQKVPTTLDVVRGDEPDSAE